MKFDAPEEVIIHQIETLQQLRDNGKSLANCTIQALDLASENIHWSDWQIHNTTFLGCTLRLEDEIQLRRKGAYIYRAPEGLPYNPFRKQLYSWQELMEGYSEAGDISKDLRIYRHFSGSRFNPSINEALWQRIHDHGIDDALRGLLKVDQRGMSDLKCVGFMGGHGTLRNHPNYIKAAKTARLLARKGYFIATGGGPGIMEAANFGAYCSNFSERDFLNALEQLEAAPHYEDAAYFRQAMSVIRDFPEGAKSLAIPTWFYGHEPSNLFATHIAKYFSNSIREDTLLAICLHGIVFAPGSAGTTQEIFMDAAQNHYGTFNFLSPMVFLDREHYEIKTSIFPLLKQLAWGKKYFDLLHLADTPEEVLDFVIHHPPVSA